MVTMYQRVLHKSRTALRATEDENWLKQEKLTGSDVTLVMECNGAEVRETGEKRDEAAVR